MDAPQLLESTVELVMVCYALKILVNYLSEFYFPSIRHKLLSYPAIPLISYFLMGRGVLEFLTYSYACLSWFKYFIVSKNYIKIIKSLRLVTKQVISIITKIINSKIDIQSMNQMCNIFGIPSKIEAYTLCTIYMFDFCCYKLIFIQLIGSYGPFPDTQQADLD